MAAAVALLLRNDNDINKLQVSNLPVVTQVKQKLIFLLFS